VTDKPTRSHNSRLSGGNDDDDDDDDGDCDGCETLTDAQAVACCSSSELFIVLYLSVCLSEITLCCLCNVHITIVFHTNDK